MPKDSIVVLGVHDGHNAGVSLIKDGKVLVAVNEERYTNIKNYSGIPRNSIQNIFQISQVSSSEITAIAIGGLLRTTAPLVEEESLKLKLYRKLGPILKSHKMTSLYVKFLHKRRKMKELNKIFQSLNIHEKPVYFVEHHLAHAACAFYQRPWKDDTLILTLDGAGDGLSATVSVGTTEGIKRIASTTSYHSISNNMYSEITGYLGLKRWEHEYKIMGMAPYGRSEFVANIFRKYFSLNPKNRLEFKNMLGAMGDYVQPKFRKLLAEHRFDNIAAACQLHFESLMKKWVNNAIIETDLHKIACSGGSFLNVKANKEIRELDQVTDVFFYPVCDDSGISTGAALSIYNQLCEIDGKKPNISPLSDLYLGREFEEKKIKNTIEKSSKLNFTYNDEIEETIAEELNQGKIIAIFNGREEFGPRALGNRSIVAKADDLAVIRKINFAIKQRDFWMPFAPSIIEEDADKYLINARPARYMIEAFSTNPEAKEIIAGLHPYDSTARPQTVNEWNNNWLKILTIFKELSGYSGILNTSYNLHGFPIVGTPEVAIKTFLKSGLDILAIGNFIVKKC
ncbi:MAG: carbamoyltransferase C-terminal domain-containing protein [Promethearchaeota archaeon]